MYYQKNKKFKDTFKIKKCISAFKFVKMSDSELAAKSEGGESAEAAILEQGFIVITDNRPRLYWQIGVIYSS